MMPIRIKMFNMIKYSNLLLILPKIIIIKEATIKDKYEFINKIT